MTGVANFLVDGAATLFFIFFLSRIFTRPPEIVKPWDKLQNALSEKEHFQKIFYKARDERDSLRGKLEISEREVELLKIENARLKTSIESYRERNYR